MKRGFVVAAVSALSLAITANSQSHPFDTFIMLPTCNDTGAIAHLDTTRVFYDSSSILTTRLLAKQQRQLNSIAALLDPACVKARQELMASEQTFVDRVYAFVNEAYGFSHRYRREWCIAVTQPGLSGLVFDDTQSREMAFGEVANRHEEIKLAYNEIVRRLKVEGDKCGGADRPTLVPDGVTAEAEDTARTREEGQSSATDTEWEHAEL